MSEKASEVRRTAITLKFDILPDVFVETPI